MNPFNLEGMLDELPAATWKDFTRELGDNVARIREKRGLSQEQIVSITGLSRQTYQRIERGALPESSVANPTLSTLLSIVVALDVDIQDIIPPLDREMILRESYSAGKRVGMWRNEVSFASRTMKLQS